MKKIFVWVLIGILWMGCRGQVPASPSGVHVDGRWIKDGQGRVLLLRGANFGSSTKVPPFLPCGPSLAGENFRTMKGYGFTVVRLLMIWEAIEPSLGMFNTYYLDQLDTILAAADQAGISVFLDMHQDVFSRTFCGDGAPEWAALTYLEAPACPSPWPIPPGPSVSPPYFWPNNYFSTTVEASFDNFWTNAGLQEHFIESFLQAVKTAKDHPSVIGYEIFNEPFPGSIQFFSSDFETTRLQPFYETIVPRIRAVDPDRIVFLEPSVAANYGGKTYLTKMPFSNLVLSPHYYQVTPGSSRDQALADLGALDKECNGQLGGIPWILGEFGVDPKDVNQASVLGPQLDVLDGFPAGWTFWNYNAAGMPDWNAEGMSMLNPDGSERWVVDYLARPYPRKTAGVPKTLSFDMITRTLTYVYTEDSAASSPTEIFVPAARHYPGGFTITVSDGATSWDPSTQILQYSADRSKSPHTITIAPK